MRWEDCVKRDLERVGGEWRTTAKQKKEFETVDRERNERKVRKEKTTKNTTVTVANFTPDDRDAKRRTTNAN